MEKSIMLYFIILMMILSASISVMAITPELEVLNAQYYAYNTLGKDNAQIEIMNTGDQTLELGSYKLYYEGNSVGYRPLDYNTLWPDYMASFRFYGGSGPLYTQEYCQGMVPFEINEGEQVDYRYVDVVKLECYGFEENTYPLSNFWDAFIQNGGQFNGYFVVGAKSDPSDVIALNNVISIFNSAAVKKSWVKTETGGYWKEEFVPIPSSRTVFDNEISDPKNKNIVSVGSRCVNSVTSELLGHTIDCASDIGPGQARIKLYKPSSKTHALIIYGYSDIDMKNANNVLNDIFKGRVIPPSDDISIIDRGNGAIDINSYSGPVQTTTTTTLKATTTTSTTTMRTTTTTVPVCTDSDSGKNYQKKGKTCIGNVCNTDYCKSTYWVMEHYCQSSQSARVEEYLCPYECEEGACKDYTDEHPCKEIGDNGFDEFNKGTVYGYMSTYNAENTLEDYCSGDVLFEYRCADYEAGMVYNYEWKEIVCPYGCKDGACLKTPLEQKTTTTILPTTTTAIVTSTTLQIPEDNKEKNEDNKEDTKKGAIVELKTKKFTQCLSEKGVYLFGSSADRFTIEQKQLFGSSSTDINFLDCENAREWCDSIGIKGYPTWRIPGSEEIFGLTDLNTLGLKTGCMYDECEGCYVGTECLNVGHRLKDTYCSDAGLAISMKEKDFICSQDYECMTGKCKEGTCTGSGFFQRLRDVLKALF